MASQTKEKRSSRRSEQPEQLSTTMGSPRVISREKEKDQLIHLNDRLAAYIDKVRSLEFENNRLHLQISSIEETVNSEKSNIKEVYEKEIEDARRLLDQTAGEKARLQIENGKYKSDLDDLRPRVKKLEKDLGAANNRISGLESSLAEKDGRNRALANEKRNLEDQLNELRKELDKKDKQLHQAKKQVEEETVLRVDLENRLQSLKEDLAFKEQLFKEELKEHTIRRTFDMTDVDMSSGDMSNVSLVDALKDLREQHDEQKSAFKFDPENLPKFNDPKTIEAYRKECTRCQEELRKVKDLQGDKDSELSTLRAQNDALVARIKDLEKRIKNEEVNHRDALSVRDDDLQNLQEKINDQLNMYQDLMNIKLSLDAEITTYRKLLEGEETRLRIEATPPPQKKTPKKQQKTKGPDRSQRRGQKRRRVEDTRSTVYNATAAGVVAIQDSDAKGDFIKLHNTSELDQPLGGWILKRSVDGGKDVTYKFTSKYVLKAGAEVTVWSSGSGEKQNLPTDILSKVPSWGTGETINTTLVDASGEVMATRNLLQEVVEYDDTTFGTDVEGDPEEEKRCVIM